LTASRGRRYSLIRIPYNVSLSARRLGTITVKDGGTEVRRESDTTAEPEVGLIVGP